VPVYSVPSEPVVYTRPAPTYYLGGYTPRFLDAERLKSQVYAMYM
jgi:hypothetical protein